MEVIQQVLVLPQLVVVTELAVRLHRVMVVAVVVLVQDQLEQEPGEVVLPVRVMMEVMVLQVLEIGLEEEEVQGKQGKMVSLTTILPGEVAHRHLIH